MDENGNCVFVVRAGVWSVSRETVAAKHIIGWGSGLGYRRSCGRSANSILSEERAYERNGTRAATTLTTKPGTHRSRDNAVRRKGKKIIDLYANVKFHQSLGSLSGILATCSTHPCRPTTGGRSLMLGFGLLTFFFYFRCFFLNSFHFACFLLIFEVLAGFFFVGHICICRQYSTQHTYSLQIVPF